MERQKSRGRWQGRGSWKGREMVGAGKGACAIVPVGVVLVAMEGVVAGVHNGKRNWS